MINRTITIVFFISFFMVSSAFATIWHVNSNPGNPDADFTTLQAAHDSVSAGDILYVYGSATNYGNLTLTKEINIYGPGYFLGENPDSRANTGSAHTGTITFNSGSEGSLISGMDIDNKVSINASNITVKRNVMKYSLAEHYEENYLLTVESGVSNIIITQNYIENTSTEDYYNRLPKAIRVEGNSSNITISNNFITTRSTDLNVEALKASSSSENITVSHNVFRGKVQMYNGIFQNNILREGGFSVSNVGVTYNICNATQFAEYDSTTNITNQNMDDVFVISGTTDGQWQLQDGSPAIGSGLDGVDIGMFGGGTPYKLSGIVALPTVYFFSAPAVVGHQSELNVHMKIKSND